MSHDIKANKLLKKIIGILGYKIFPKYAVKTERFIEAKNIFIENSNIGIASKDQSSVYLDNITIDNVFIGLAAYIKKIEYGLPKIKGSNINLTNFKHDYISDLKSLIVINDQRINNIDCKENIKVCNF